MMSNIFIYRYAEINTYKKDSTPIYVFISFTWICCKRFWVSTLIGIDLCLVTFIGRVL